MNTPAFRTARGNLTAYAFHCGYQETADKGTYTTRLYHEGNAYHALVRFYDPGARARWDSARTLKEARQKLRAMVQE